MMRGMFVWQRCQGTVFSVESFEHIRGHGVERIWSGLARNEGRRRGG